MLGWIHDIGDDNITETVNTAIQATVTAQKLSLIHIGAKHGLKWSIITHKN